MLMGEWKLVKMRGKDWSWSILWGWAHFPFKIKKKKGKKNDFEKATR